jgi:hypothetical protein
MLAFHILLAEVKSQTDNENIQLGVIHGEVETIVHHEVMTTRRLGDLNRRDCASNSTKFLHG